MKNRKIKVFSMVVSAAALVLVGIAGTVAYLSDQTDTVTNTFTAGTLPPIVVEDFDGNTKENVRIQNTGTVDAYIRAKVLINWVSSTDSNAIASEIPQVNKDYEVEYGDESTADDAPRWIFGEDGYYYWTDVVEAGKETGILLKKVMIMENAVAPDGYQPSVSILSQSIQADGKDSSGVRPVVLAWGTTESGDKGGSVTGVDESTLQLQIDSAE